MLNKVFTACTLGLVLTGCDVAASSDSTLNAQTLNDTQPLASGRFKARKIGGDDFFHTLGAGVWKLTIAKSALNTRKDTTCLLVRTEKGYGAGYGLLSCNWPEISVPNSKNQSFADLKPTDFAIEPLPQYDLFHTLPAGSWELSIDKSVFNTAADVPCLMVRTGNGYGAGYGLLNCQWATAPKL